MRGFICNLYAGCRVNYKVKYYSKRNFCIRTHIAKLGNGIKYQRGVMQGYLCNMCRVVNKTQYKTT